MTDKNDTIVNNRLQQIMDSTLTTIQDPQDKKARKADCYAQCAFYVQQSNNQNCEIAIFGAPNGEPMHGVVIDEGGEIVKDTFSDYRISVSEDGQKASYRKSHQKLELERLATITPDMWLKEDYKEEIEWPENIDLSNKTDKEQTLSNSNKPRKKI